MERKQFIEPDKTVRRIGIMGGTFDPIHNGHLMIAENARQQYGLEQVQFIPTGHSPLKHKQQITDALHRCNMVSLAISANQWFTLNTIEVSSQEISYTFHTLNKLKELYFNAELFFILGADSLFDFESWKNPELILESCSVLAAYRTHQRQNEFLKQIQYLNGKYPGKFYPLDTPNLEVSSQELRHRIQEKQTIRYLVPDKADAYIREKKLYQRDKNSPLLRNE